MSIHERRHYLEGKLDRTSQEDMELVYMDLRKTYEGIEDPQDITQELINHYFDIKDKELTADHRDIFRLTPEQRMHDFKDPCRPNKKFLKEKGDAIDNICELLGIEKDRNFHEQIKEREIYEEDIKKSDWYRYVLTYKFLITEIFGLTVGADFEENPLKFTKMFCFKALGISCELVQSKGMHPDDHKGLWKEHMKQDIYRKHYGGTPRGDLKKRIYSDDWINKKVDNEENLTREEQRLRRLRKHIKINLNQPRYKRYLSSFEKSPLLNIEIKNEIGYIKQTRGRT